MTRMLAVVHIVVYILLSYLKFIQRDETDCIMSIGMRKGM